MEKHHFSTTIFALIIFISTILFQFHPTEMNEFFQQMSISPKIVAYFVIISGIIGLIPFGMSFKIETKEPEQETELDPDYEAGKTFYFLTFNMFLLLRVIFTSLVLTISAYYFIDGSLHSWCKEGTNTLSTIILLFLNGISSIILGYRTFLLLEFKSISKAKGIESLAGQIKHNPNRIRDKGYGYGYIGRDTRSINRHS